MRGGFRRARHGLAALAVLAATAWPAAVSADTVYVYRDARGSILITDHPRSAAGYQLVRTHGQRPRAPVSRIRPESAQSNGFSGFRPIASQFDDLIDHASRENGVDLALLKAVVHAESAFDPDAVSHKGAVGLMQLMPATALDYGVADRRDPRQNLSGGSRHLKYLLDRYRDTVLALAAYNAGIEAVRRHGGVPPFNETEQYVRRVLRLKHLYSQG